MFRTYNKKNSKFKIILILLTICIVVISAIVLNNKFKRTKRNLNELTTKVAHQHSKIDGMLIRDQDDQQIFVGNDIYISQFIIFKGSWEEHLRNVIKQVVKPKQKILIFGGHFGVHTVLFSRLVGAEGKVYVFEPNPDALQALKINIFLNPLKNITLYEKAAFSEDKELKFISVESSKNSGGSHIATSHETTHQREVGNEITVQAVKADSIPELVDAGPIDILQMDIEGAEAQAVFGAKKIIDNSPNLIVLQEWSVKWMPDDAKEYLQFWRERGYRFAKITNNQLIEMSDDELLNSPAIDIVIAKNLDQITSEFKPITEINK